MVEARAGEDSTAALQVVDDIVAHLIHLVGDDERRLVRLEAVHDEVDDLALDGNQDDGVDRQADLLEGNEGGERNAGIDNQHEGAEGNLGVFVQDHGDDVAAAGSGAGLENEADGHAVDDASHHGVQEIVGTEKLLAVRNLHKTMEAFAAVQDALMNDRVVPPRRFQQPCEEENQDGGNHGLDTEARTEHPSADKQQGNIHADGVIAYLPRPNGVEHVGKAIRAARCQQIGVHEHHIAHREEETTQN